jgi:hypothetical protein
MNAEKVGAVTAAIVIMVVVLTVGPLLLIWGLNTLLGMTIQFTFWNWLAGLAIIAVLRGGK